MLWLAIVKALRYVKILVSTRRQTARCGTLRLNSTAVGLILSPGFGEARFRGDRMPGGNGAPRGCA